jgi:hypothetical protein
MPPLLQEKKSRRTEKGENVRRQVTIGGFKDNPLNYFILKNLRSFLQCDRM